MGDYMTIKMSKFNLQAIIWMNFTNIYIFFLFFSKTLSLSGIIYVFTYLLVSIFIYKNIISVRQETAAMKLKDTCSLEEKL